MTFLFTHKFRYNLKIANIATATEISIENNVYAVPLSVNMRRLRKLIGLQVLDRDGRMSR